MFRENGGTMSTPLTPCLKGVGRQKYESQWSQLVNSPLGVLSPFRFSVNRDGTLR